jgi:hypothetical protein
LGVLARTAAARVRALDPAVIVSAHGPVIMGARIAHRAWARRRHPRGTQTSTFGVSVTDSFGRNKLEPVTVNVLAAPK